MFRLTLPVFIKWATTWENQFIPYANTKDADQPAHPHSLISGFVICCLDSIIPLVLKTLAISVAEQASLTLNWSQTPENRFSHDGTQRKKRQRSFRKQTMWCGGTAWQENFLTHICLVDNSIIIYDIHFVKKKKNQEHIWLMNKHFVLSTENTPNPHLQPLPPPMGWDQG